MLKGTITFYSDVQKYIRSQVMAFKKIFHRQKITLLLLYNMRTCSDLSCFITATLKIIADFLFNF